MRVTGINMYSSTLSEALSFSLSDVDTRDPYLIRGIQGLDAMDLVPKFYTFSQLTQSKYYEFSMKAREIVMRVALNPNFRVDDSFSDLRDDLYRAISAQRTGEIALHFMSGPAVVAKITGLITKFEASYFTKLPEAQLTITCADPIFRGLNPVHMDNTNFPASPVLIPDSISTAPHGFEIQVTFTTATSAFQMRDVSTTNIANMEWEFSVTPSPAFAIGDKLYLSSDFGGRDLYVTRSGGAVTHLMDKVSLTSVWPLLFPGQNTIYWPQISYFTVDFLNYYPAYWGV